MEKKLSFFNVKSQDLFSLIYLYPIENDSENQNEDDNLVQDIITTSKVSQEKKLWSTFCNGFIRLDVLFSSGFLDVSKSTRIIVSIKNMTTKYATESKFIPKALVFF